MFFWLFLLICNMLLPVIMMIAGRAMWKHCPKEINSIYGYRTKRSMLNQDTWRFAHEYCGKLWYRIGAILLIATILAFLPFTNSSEQVTGMIGLIPCIVQCIAMILSVLLTESALKRTYFRETKPIAKGEQYAVGTDKIGKEGL